MSDNEKLLRQAEGLAGYRRVMLVVNALSYTAWVVSFALGQTGMGDLPPRLLTMIGLAAFPVWLISLIALVWGIRRLARDKALGALIDDERTRDLTKRAFQAGYWALLLALAGLYAVSYFTDINIRLIVPFLLAFGVAAPSLTYAALYRS